MPEQQTNQFTVPTGVYTYEQLGLWADENTRMPDELSASLGVAALLGKYDTPDDLILPESNHADDDHEHTFGQELGQTEAVESIEDTNEYLDLDEYLTPYEKKQKSVTGWLEQIVEDYEGEVSASKQLTKKSKRDRQRELVDRRFKRNFESFTEDGRHVVYDAEALGIILDQLALRPSIAGKVVESAVEYLHKNSVEFASSAPAFAGLIRQSLPGRMSAHSFDRLLTSLYETIEFLNHPEKAVALQVALAHTVFETTEESNIEYYEKILDIAYLRNDIIPNKELYATSLEGVAGSRILEDSPDALITESANARHVFAQTARAYGNDYTVYYESILPYAKQELVPRVFRKLVPNYTHVRSLARLHGVDDDFFQNPQHYDPFELFSLATGEHIELPLDGKTIPERWREVYTGSELYKKRLELLAPRALAKDILVSTLNNKFNVDMPSAAIISVPVSPGLTIDFAWLADEGFTENPDSTILTHFLTEYGRTIDFAKYNTGETGSVVSAFQHVSIEDESGKPAIVGMMIVRKSVPEDLKNVPKQSALSLSFLDRVADYAKWAEAAQKLELKRDYIRANRHNYFGRRPVLFKLPEHLGLRGLDAMDIRQDSDRKRLVATAHHAEGDVAFYFDTDFNSLSKNLDGSEVVTSLDLAIQDLVLTLAAEWVCRPVVETSEGPVSIEDSKSRVNLGFLRYLPVGSNPSQRQAQIFKLEQNGNLVLESGRRISQDPKGLGRKSTYVRENYDPKVPALEVYCDVELA